MILALDENTESSTVVNYIPKAAFVGAESTVSFKQEPLNSDEDELVGDMVEMGDGK